MREALDLPSDWRNQDDSKMLTTFSTDWGKQQCAVLVTGQAANLPQISGL